MINAYLFLMCRTNTMKLLSSFSSVMESVDLARPKRQNLTPMVSYSSYMLIIWDQALTYIFEP